MERIIEEHINTEGKTVYIERFIGQTNQAVLITKEKNLIPMVDSVEYDPEHEVFLVRDNYHDVYQDNRKPTVKANLYYYVDFDGKPVGLGYSDISNGFFDVKIKENLEETDDRWFVGYANFKFELGLSLGEELDAKKQYNSKATQKMLNVKK